MLKGLQNQIIDEMERELAYRNLEFEEKTKLELQKALEAQQRLLDTWNALDLGLPCTNLFYLIHNPQKVYADAVKEVTTIPISHGKYQIAQGAFMQFLDVPVPNELYVRAREAKNQIQCGRPELWSIEDNKTVKLNQELAEALIHSNDVWVENEEQKKFVDSAVRYIETGIYLHDKLINMAGMGTLFNTPFRLVEGHRGFVPKLRLELVQLRELLKQI